MKHVLILLLLFISFASCNQKADYKWLCLNSNNPDSLVLGFYSLEKTDTIFVPAILSDPYDRRVSHSFKYYGHSVYRAKMNSLKTISGLTPKDEIVNKPDSATIEFYTNWAKRNGYTQKTSSE